MSGEGYSVNEVRHTVYLSVGVGLSFAFSRFAYVLILPSDLVAGFGGSMIGSPFNIANICGYLLGILLVVPLIRSLGARQTILASMGLSGFVLLGSGMVDTRTEHISLGALGGLSTAVLFLSGLVSTIEALSRGSRRSSLSIASVYAAVAGVGIVLPGILLSPSSGVLGAAARQAGWVWLAIATFLSIIPAGVCLSGRPNQCEAECGLPPRSAISPLLRIGLCYGVYGAGYSTYLTSMAVSVSAQAQMDRTFYWIITGLSCLLGPLLWCRLLPVFGPRNGFAAISACLACGAIILDIWPVPMGLIVAAVIFGGASMAAVVAAALMVRRLIPASAFVTGVCFIACVFILGQAGGLLVRHYVAQTSGSLTALWVAPMCLISAALVAGAGGAGNPSRHQLFGLTRFRR